MGGRLRAIAAAIVLTLTGGLAVAIPAALVSETAAVAATITAEGPLTSITTSLDLNCAVDHAGDTFGEFYNDTACGTFAVVNGTMFSPADIPAGLPGTPWTSVSQVGPTGTGTSEDPFTLVTVVDAGTTGVRLTQTDTYVTGEESYRTDVAIANTSAADTTVRLYRAGDCYLQDSDFGLGVVDTATGAVACKSVASERIEQFLPITADSSYFEAEYHQVWSQIAAGLPFPDTCRCAENIDNGAGLSWDAAVPAGATRTVSSILTFSPLGILPLTVEKTADAGESAPGGTNGYTIVVNNPNVVPVALASITDALPSGFSYVAGSSTGATTSDPTIEGGTLTWAGPLAVPADGSTTLHFGVTVATAPGTYTNEASASADGFTVAPSGPAAPITVTAPVSSLSISSEGQPASVTAGENALRIITVTNTGEGTAEDLSVEFTLPPGATLVRTTPSQGTCGAVVEGVVTCALGDLAAGASANVRFVIDTPATPGATVTTSATATSGGGEPVGPAESTTSLIAPAPGAATGYVPPGGTLSTGSDATAASNTQAAFTLPNTGEGAVISITSVPCAPGQCLGKTMTYTPFEGYDDPANPPKFAITWDKTVAGAGLFTQLYKLNETDTSFKIVPPCQPPPERVRVRQGGRYVWVIKKIISTIIDWLIGGRTGYARPSPCVDVKTVLRNGDVRFEARALSGDPSWRRR